MDLIKMRFSELESGRKGKELFRELGFITMAASRLNKLKSEILGFYYETANIQDSVIEDCEGKEEEFNAKGLEEKLCRNVLQVAIINIV